MKPVKFKEANAELGKPPSMTDDECGSLPVFKDGKQCISLWKLSFKERLQVLFFGKIWLGVISGMTQPPVWLDSSKTVFKSSSPSITWFNLHPKFFKVFGWRLKVFNLFCRVMDEGWCFGAGLFQCNGRHLIYLGVDDESLKFDAFFAHIFNVRYKK